MPHAPSVQGSQKPFWLARSTRTVFFFAAVLTVAGIYLALQVPIAVFPQTNFPRIVIGVDNGVMPAEQMQVTITRPIEDAVNSVPGLVTVRSTTSRGSAEVSLFFDWHEDMMQELQLVDAALGKVEQTLPSTVRITTNRLTFATFPILGYSLTSDSIPQTRLWEIATYDLKPPLNRVPGVSTVTVQGGQVPEIHVIPNLAQLQASGVTLTDLVNAIQASNIIDSPGLYEANHQLILGLVGAQVHDAGELRKLVVKTTPGGAPVHVEDVAQVVPSTMPVYTTVTANGKQAVLLNIARQPSSNTVTVADAVAAQVAQLRAKLPPGVTLTPYYDQSQLVRDAIASVRDAIVLGLVLACIILFLFLRDWTSSLIAGLVIPVTVAVTIVVLWTIGQSFNLMTLGGLAAAIGLVIDDAIVVVENIVLHRDSGEPRIEAVRKALAEISTPLVGSTLTPVVVFLPLVAVSGVTGSFFRALAITMTAALLTSLALALTWTPGLGLSLLREHSGHQAGIDHGAGPMMSRVLHIHRRMLDWSLARPIWLGICCLALVAATWGGYKALGSNLLPEMDEGGFILDYIMPAGSSLAETNRVLDHVSRILHSIPEVEGTSRRTGLQMGLAAVTEANTGDFTIKLKSDRHRSVWQ
ncbi:MAG TPA: efflux RND transporter permease subunit, partial [Terracidiphilus sp.]|nr:efflux RND transporter permease subunit [Terracidiphilus sp.]